MELIEGVVRGYSWGSPTAIPELLCRPATGEPWAELWLGAHPAVPARLGAGAEPLDRLIADDPAAALGAAVAERFGRLPFLLKVLAAAAPLSLQAHPSAEQAEAGHQREEALQIPAGAPERMFRDRSHKPELLCALSEFEALCGFRHPARTAELLESLDAAGLDPLRERLSRCDATNLRELLRWLLTLEPSAAASLAGAVTESCAAASGSDEWSGARSAVARLGALHPGDAAVAAALLMNHLTLAPGEAVFLHPGCLHAYLGGTAVELMATSDNVVRGGLTSKHVDVAALVEIVDGAPAEPPIQRPEPRHGVVSYHAPVPEFSLRRLEVDGAMAAGRGPAVLLCVDGSVQAAGVTLDRGSAAWVDGTEPEVVLSGRASVFRAGAGIEP